MPIYVHILTHTHTWMNMYPSTSCKNSENTKPAFNLPKNPSHFLSPLLYLCCLQVSVCFQSHVVIWPGLAVALFSTLWEEIDATVGPLRLTAHCVTCFCEKWTLRDRNSKIEAAHMIPWTFPLAYTACGSQHMCEPTVGLQLIWLSTRVTSVGHYRAAAPCKDEELFNAADCNKSRSVRWRDLANSTKGEKYILKS